MSKRGSVTIWPATEDGSMGYKGSVVDLLEDILSAVEGDKEAYERLQDSLRNNMGPTPESDDEQ